MKAVFLFYYILAMILWFFIVRALWPKKVFSYAKFSFFLVVPMIAPVYMLVTYGMQYAFFLLFSIFSGLAFEMAIGKWYLSFFGEYLWQYNRLHIYKFTSWLTLPLWLLGGNMLYMVTKLM